MLERLLADGIEYVFVSNSDNLGATLDLQLLSHFANSGYSFMMEVCKRTQGDKKGGHLAKRKSDGRLILRESAMCPGEDKPIFEDIEVHKYFNTNNLWLNLKHLKTTLESCGGTLKLPLIKNKKTVNPRDPSTENVFQLETAMGSAIECFENSAAIEVPRTRFAPVKTSSDLFALRSDAYKITDASTIALVADAPPFVKLDDEHYKLVDQMESLARRVPSLVDCKSLMVKGRIQFGPQVVIRGSVVLKHGKLIQSVTLPIYELLIPLSFVSIQLERQRRKYLRGYLKMLTSKSKFTFFCILLFLKLCPQQACGPRLAVQYEQEICSHQRFPAAWGARE